MHQAEQNVLIKPIRKLQGEIEVPGDKSISHRAALFGGMARGNTQIKNFLLGQDCLSTLDCLTRLGVKWQREGSEIWIEGNGYENWNEPEDILDVGNSGTTMRLMLGVLAGSPFSSTLTGDASIRSRPMRRVTAPLQQMGAQILGRTDSSFAPLTIKGGELKGIDFISPVASAQVKSAIILAGLRARGETTVSEPELSRDHTERMLRGFGVDVISRAKTVSVKGGARLLGQAVQVPGDISSAAFFLVLGSLVPQSEILIRNVGVNPTRTGIIDVLIEMGADIQLENVHEACGEPRADLRVRTANLRGIEIRGEVIPRLIDEIPILAVAASLAEGKTVIRDAAELRVKETDRIRTVSQELNRLGARVEELPDGLIITGQKGIRGGHARSLGDHRLAMSWCIAGLLSQEGVSIEGMSAANVSFPNFLEILNSLIIE